MVWRIACGASRLSDRDQRRYAVHDRPAPCHSADVSPCWPLLCWTGCSRLLLPGGLARISARAGEKSLAINATARVGSPSACSRNGARHVTAPECRHVTRGRLLAGFGA